VPSSARVRWGNKATNLRRSRSLTRQPSRFLLGDAHKNARAERANGMAGMRFAVMTLMASLAFFSASAAPARASEVPLGESGGIYTVPGEINRAVTLQFLVDPGSAVVVIPRSVLSRLILNGTVTEDDVVGVSIAELADRSLYQTVRIRLRELRVGDNFARDVIASVAPGLNHPLLGQSFLKRFASVTLDNQRRVLILSGPGMAIRAGRIRVPLRPRNIRRQWRHRHFIRPRRRGPTALIARRATGLRRADLRTERRGAG